MKKLILSLALFAGMNANAAKSGDYLLQLQGNLATSQMRLLASLPEGSSVTSLGFNNWVQVNVPQSALRSVTINALQSSSLVKVAQPNYRVKILDNPNIAKIKEKIASLNMQDLPDNTQPPADNPPIPAPGQIGSGNDPLFNSQWGMINIGMPSAWSKSKGRKDVVVAVLDTGIDYTHEDLRDNLWRNPGEKGTDAQGRDKATNGIDDDHNGYVDDTIGWDFVSNDKLPFDLSVSMFELLAGGNPGHGTHCAGNVASRGFNGKGISGVAPNVSIMGLRFLSEKGEGTTAGAVSSIIYAVKNGAHILSNSWGSEGEDDNAADNKALRDAIKFAEQEGRLFIAAAGNGHQGAGYDNDKDSNPAYPASYPDDIILSVAAIDLNDNFGSFSNWGKSSTDIAAPGVKVFSTTVGGKYSDTVIDIPGMITATWDGTSMATPHVAGAAALYLSANPNTNWRDLKQKILQSAVQLNSLKGKLVSDGKLNVANLLGM